MMDRVVRTTTDRRSHQQMGHHPRSATFLLQHDAASTAHQDLEHATVIVLDTAPQDRLAPAAIPAHL